MKGWRRRTLKNKVWFLKFLHIQKFWSFFWFPYLCPVKCLNFDELWVYFRDSESGSAVVVGQNGEINLDRDVKTGESSEGSQEQSNLTKILPTCNALDATTTTHNVGSHLQGHVTEPSSVPLFIQLMTKFRSSLKSHSNLSLLLATIIALIFFIQVCTLNMNFDTFMFFLFI